MTVKPTQIPVSSIILDETIYPRKGIDHRRVGMFAENIRDGIAKQMGINQASIHNHLLKMATLPNLINADLVRGFTVAQVARKHGWGLSMQTGGIFRTRRHQKKNIKAASS
jgi:hypothetical protein